MRIALVLASNLYMAPYVRYYTKILDRLEIDYDIISWNRAGVEEQGVTAFSLKEHQFRFLVILDYLRYRRFVKKKLAEQNYDKLVIFTCFLALLNLPLLKTQYKNNYVFDIRDYSIAIKYFPNRFSAVIKNAALVVISSGGFRQWLPPKNTYIIGHNAIDSRPQAMRAEIEGQSIYKILTIGSLRDFKANRTLIESLANDSEFELKFVGSGPAEHLLKDWVMNLGIANVYFHGRYDKQDESRYLEGASLMNILTNEDINSMTLMTNRFYLSLIFGIPVIVNDNTEQSRWVKQYNLGVVIDNKTDIKGQIMRYFRGFDLAKFEAGRNACLKIVREDIEKFEARFESFLALS